MKTFGRILIALLAPALIIALVKYTSAAWVLFEICFGCILYGIKEVLSRHPMKMLGYFYIGTGSFGITSVLTDMKTVEPNVVPVLAYMLFMFVFAAFTTCIGHSTNKLCDGALFCCIVFLGLFPFWIAIKENFAQINTITEGISFLAWATMVGLMPIVAGRFIVGKRPQLVV